MATHRKWATYSNVMSTIAVVLAMGGASAWAATQIDGHSIKNHSIAGKKLANNTVTGAQVKESTLGSVRSAATAGRLTVLKSGQSESGMFSAGGANSVGAGGYLGAGITYPKPLKTPILDSHIVEVTSGSTTHCSGAGHADRGYLCLYDSINSGVDAGYGYSQDTDFSSPSVGVVLYWPVTGDAPYSGGEWTVTAP